MLGQYGEEGTTSGIKYYISTHAGKLAIDCGGECCCSGIKVAHKQHGLMLGVKQL